MAGGKGGSQTSSVEIPEYIEAAAQRNLNKAERISQLGYVPYYGPDVAAFTPMQQAAMQNVAGAAGAFGMAAPTGQDIYGMPAPTEYAGGIQGYSSAPMFEQAQAELAARRPAQKSYIDSFFIDPFTGQYAYQPTDYTQYQTGAQERAAQRANDLAIAQAQAGPQTVNYELTSFSANPNLAVQPNDQIFNIAPPEVQLAQQIIATDPTNPNYNEAFQTVYDYQSQQAVSDPTGMSTGFGITPEVLDAAGIENFMAPQVDLSGEQASEFITTPASGITDTSTAGTGTQIMNDITEGVTGLASNTLLGNLLLGDSYNVGAANNPIETPTVAEMEAAAPTGMTYNTATGSYTQDDDAPSPTVTPKLPSDVEAEEDLPGNVISRALNIGAGKKDDSSDSGYAGESGDGCVVATHAVSSGAFTPSMKREAVVWCMHNLHDKWWGEAIRRGYRHLGRKKIEQGKAHEHYQEFRNYIDFASGKKRTIKGAIHFAARTVQFFAVGLVKGDA